MTPEERSIGRLARARLRQLRPGSSPSPSGTTTTATADTTTTTTARCSADPRRRPHRRETRGAPVRARAGARPVSAARRRRIRLGRRRPPGRQPGPRGDRRAAFRRRGGRGRGGRRWWLFIEARRPRRGRAGTPEDQEGGDGGAHREIETRQSLARASARRMRICWTNWTTRFAKSPIRARATPRSRKGSAT